MSPAQGEPDYVADKYGREMGDDARERQVELAKRLYRCCGEPKGGDHNEACHLYVADKPPQFIDGQESLL